jgi:hypothetical protein
MANFDDRTRYEASTDVKKRRLIEFCTYLVAWLGYEKKEAAPVGENDNGIDQLNLL